MIDEKIYNSGVISKNFGIMNRWEIYQQVLKHDKLCSVSGDELLQDLDSLKFKESFVLMKWQTGAIPIEKWRYYLSTADFIFSYSDLLIIFLFNAFFASSTLG